MGHTHYVVTTERMPCAIVLDDSRYIFLNHLTVASQERTLKKINATWMMREEREYTILADTDGGCDRIKTNTYYHELKIENAIFDGDEIIGFYFEYDFYNGYSSKPNAHIFLFDNPKTLSHYNNSSTWQLMKKE